VKHSTLSLALVYSSSSPDVNSGDWRQRGIESFSIVSRFLSSFHLRVRALILCGWNKKGHNLRWGWGCSFCVGETRRGTIEVRVRALILCGWSRGEKYQWSSRPFFSSEERGDGREGEFWLCLCVEERALAMWELGWAPKFEISAWRSIIEMWVKPWRYFE